MIVPQKWDVKKMIVSRVQLHDSSWGNDLTLEENIARLFFNTNDTTVFAVDFVLEPIQHYVREYCTSVCHKVGKISWSYPYRQAALLLLLSVVGAPSCEDGSEESTEPLVRWWWVYIYNTMQPPPPSHLLYRHDTWGGGGVFIGGRMVHRPCGYW